MYKYYNFLKEKLKSIEISLVMTCDIENHLSKMSTKAMIPKQYLCCEFIGTPEEKEAFNNAIFSVEYVTANTFREQVGALCNHLRKGKILVSYERIGKLFNETKHCIWDQYRNYQRGDRKDGRPSKLTKEELRDVFENVQAGHHLANPVYPTYNDISFYISQKFRKYLSDDTLRHIFRTEFLNFFKIIESNPKDADRIEVSIIDIENNLNILRNEVQGVPPNFVFNLDEVGCHDFVDASKKWVIVPKSFDSSPISHPVKRCGKRASAIVCISASGLACIPQIVVPRATIDSEIYKYIPNDSFQIVTSSSGYVNTETFKKWVTEIFIPSLNDLRKKYNYYGKAVLILDGFSPHKIVFDQIDLQKENLIIHYLVPHSSDQTQPLDLCIFGLMKKFMNDLHPPPLLTYQSKQLYKIHQAIYRSCLPINCRSAFRSIGITVKNKIVNQTFVEEIEYDLLSITSITGYKKAYIQELIQSGAQITPNQLFIYNSPAYQQNDGNVRIHI